MSVVFEPEFEALWHMFAEDSTTVADKNRALLVGGAYFYQVITPAVTHPTTKDFFMRAKCCYRSCVCNVATMVASVDDL